MKSFFLSLGILILQSSIAQTVTISDANFAAWISNSSTFSSCISGNQLDTSCVHLAIQNSVLVPTVSASFENISDLDGIQYFSGLEQLIVSGNNLMSLPSLPSSLKVVWASDNNLTSLPNLPDSIESLDVDFNSLTALPIFPAGIEQVYCVGNQLTSFPDFSYTQMRSLICDDNMISSFTGFPSTLDQLYASNNELDSLPAWNASIRDISVSANNLTWIPTLPDSVERFDAAENLIANITYLPNSITYLLLYDNQLTTLPNLPTSLEQFWCDGNQISNIPPLPSLLEDFACQDNNIFCLPILPESITQLSYFGGNNNIICAPNYLPNLNPSANNNINTLPLCDTTNSNGCASFNGIAGKIFNDTNSNCSLEVGEALTSGQIMLTDAIGDTLNLMHVSSGAFSFSNLALGNYNLTYIDGDGVEIACPGNDIINVTHTGSLQDGNDFGIICSGDFDLDVFFAYTNGSPIATFFPGETTDAYVVLGDVTDLNNGNMRCSSGISGTVDITVEGPITFVSESPGSLIPNSINGNTYSYLINDFDSLNIYTDFGLRFITDTTATGTDEITFAVNINANASENNVANNIDTLAIAVVNSYDPNMKEVFPIGDLEYPFNDRLTYTIHFQNTGNAPALNIKLKDQLDANLDWSTFQMLGASHAVEAQLSNNNLLFKFDNIYLMDSTTNEPASKGWVTYSILPNLNLPAGSTIENFADIYFDFNAPITTNTTLNTIKIGVSVTETIQSAVKVFPNPANDNITLTNLQNNATITIYNLQGQKMMETVVKNTVTRINLHHYENGIYIIKVSSEDKTETIKITKQ